MESTTSLLFDEEATLNKILRVKSLTLVSIICGLSAPLIMLWESLKYISRII